MNNNSDINREAENTNSSDNVNFTELWLKMWKAKWQISAITFVFAVTSIIIVLTLPDKFQSEVLLSPVEETDGGLGGLISKFGGLANLAGVNIGKKKLTKPKLAIEILKSRNFIKLFVARHNLLVPLMAAKDWDRDSNQLILNENDYNSQTQQWIRDVKSPKKVIPSDQEVHEKLMNIMSISNDKDTGLITISITFFSPDITKQWLDWLVEDIDAHMKNLDKVDAQRSIKYLTTELQLTNLTKMQNVFYQLIEEQTKIMMLANVRAEYVFKIIDPAIIADEKYSPRRSLIVILITFLGGLLGVVGVLLKNR